MDTEELHRRGLELRRKMFGKQAVDQRAQALGSFGEPLQNIVNAYAYGDIWSRAGLGNRERSFAMIGMIAALNRPHELKVHLQRRARQWLHRRGNPRGLAAGGAVLRHSGRQ